MKKIELVKVLNFIEKNKKHIKPTSAEWGYECLSLSDVYKLLDMLGFKIIREKKDEN